jgi:histidine ammonia-lyase
MSTFEISDKLSIEDIAGIIKQNKKLHLSSAASKRIRNCYEYLQKKADHSQEAIYGVNTGFGALCNTRIPDEQLGQLQENLLRSHACGSGAYVPQEIVKLMLLLKVQSLSYGHSGVQPATVQGLIDLFNNNILPVVFEQGSLGASGDLAPLAHLCLPLIGEGKVWEAAEPSDAKSALEKYKLSPVSLKPKEGLALINGTQFMSAYGVHLILQSQKLCLLADTVAAVSTDAFDCRLDPFHPLLHKVRPQPGQIETARNMLRLLKGSGISAQPKKQVQDPYSFRCIPQVHGASRDAIAYAATVFGTEIGSVTDNPNVFPEEDLILSGGNFHGQPLALALDFLAIALSELGSISERRTYQLISGQRGLPAFLATDPGLNSGLMIPQYTAASVVSQNKQLCTPASVDSIVSSNGQEDHVSMGANAATKCLRVLENLYTILAIELLTASQALSFREPLKSSGAIEGFTAAFRKQVPFIESDRMMQPDIEKSVKFLRETEAV